MSLHERLTRRYSLHQRALPKDQSLLLLILGSVGVVYGDIGTSPLYALRESLAGARAGGITPAEITGIVSLLLWTLFIIVTLKYVILILRADNDGEGGTLSLLALAQRAVGRRTETLLLLAISAPPSSSGMR